MHLKNRQLAVMGIIIAAIDQIAKFAVQKNISQTESIHAIPGLFDFVYVKNTGVAFSILSGSTLLLGMISLLFCVGVFVYWLLKKPSGTCIRLSMTLLLSGAFGNALDRIFRGYVVDFIQTAFIRFPVFNVADIAITTGACLLVVYLVFFDKGNEYENNNSDG